MLVEFKVSNWRSIWGEQTFSMHAGRLSELSHENTFEAGVANVPALLRSAVIYGANAAGKTNLLLALSFMQKFVLTSASLQPENKINRVAFKLHSGARNKPTTFKISFIAGSVLYQYEFAIDNDRVRHEKLVAFPNRRAQVWFERTFKSDRNDYTWKLGKRLKGDRKVWRKATRSSALFLSTAIQLNSKQMQPVFDWFRSTLVVTKIPGSDLNIGLSIKLLQNDHGREMIGNFIRTADPGILDVVVRQEVFNPSSPSGFVESKPGEVPVVWQISSMHRDDNGALVPIDFSEESHGTQILLMMAGAWLNVLQKGEILVIDELDTSLHPIMTKFLVRLFNDPVNNPKNAQLIFTTHDTSLLDAGVFRRDQIWFVEKDPGAASRFYSLAEFKPRKDELFERGYLKGRYGALPFVGAVRF